MSEVDINDLATIGVIRDRPGHMLPPEAWTLAHNMRFSDQAALRLGGDTQIFGTPPIAPHFGFPLQTNTGLFWLYTSLTKAYVYDGTNHTDITRAAGDYTASATEEWNYTILGGVPILNNGIDLPQAWLTPTIATDLTNLANWPATYRAKLFRAFGPYLLALNVNKNGTLFPHLVKWSHPADPGTIPSSWDETDTTKDAGEKDLQDVNSGVIVDALQLGNQMFVYKESSVWKISMIGGRFIFDFNTFLVSVGALAPRCVAVLPDGLRHFVVTADDIIVHNGSTASSILSERQRRSLFADIDNQNYRTSFVFSNPLREEMWFCYPEGGASYPTKALIWSLKSGQAGAFSTSDIDFRNVAVGPVADADTVGWEDNEQTWEDDEAPWDQTTRRAVVMFDPAATQFRRLDSGLTRKSIAFPATIQRESLAIIGRKRSGEWIEDWKTRKLYTRIWPKIVGGPVNIRVGTQEVVAGPITWGVAQSFDPATQVTIDPDPPVEGRALCLEVSSNTGVDWRFDGYKFEFEILGSF